MAGKLKHMERSHRSYRNKLYAFSNFHKKAYARQQKKASANFFSTLFNKAKDAIVPDKKD